MVEIKCCAICGSEKKVAATQGPGMVVGLCSKHGGAVGLLFSYQAMLASFDRVGADKKSLEDFQRDMFGWVLGLWRFFEGEKSLAPKARRTKARKTKDWREWPDNPKKARKR